MKIVFLGEEGTAIGHDSIGLDASASSSPPREEVDLQNTYIQHVNSGHLPNIHQTSDIQSIVDAYFEFWDYSGGCSFRGFVGGNGKDKAVFVFFDASFVSRDLKQALMALMELAESVFAVSRVVVCCSRSMPNVESQALHKSLQWVGFDLIPLDTWAGCLDTTSHKWLYLGLEI